MGSVCKEFKKKRKGIGFDEYREGVRDQKLAKYAIFNENALWSPYYSF